MPDAANSHSPRAALDPVPRRPVVRWWLTFVLALGFAAMVAPTITAERWLFGFAPGAFAVGQPAPFTLRAPLLSGYDQLHIRGGVVIARGEPASRAQAALADAIATAQPHGPVPYAAFFAIALVAAALFSHHLRRSPKGRLVRVQLVSLIGIAALAAIVKVVALTTTVSALVVPVAALAIVPTMVLGRHVGLATGVLAAVVISALAPFDLGLAILLLVQAATAGLVVPSRSRRPWIASFTAGAAATLCTGAVYALLTYLEAGHLPAIDDPLHSPWLAAVIGPAIGGAIAAALVPIYQRLVGEITLGRLIELEDLGNPLLKQIAEKSPGTWQHSLMMANLAEIAANAVGASGRLVRVGAYYHDLGKSLAPKYFIENLEAGEVSPHDRLAPEVSCEAIFAHVTEGIAAARKAGLHERIIDFMHMHHGDGVLEYFWAKCREQGNPHALDVADFRYPGHPPQSRETAILAICDAVEAASRTLKKPDAASIDSLVQRIVYGKLHLGQLDESGLSMSDLRRITDSLRETIRHANHARIEYPWQRETTATAPRLDSLDRKPQRDTAARPRVVVDADDDALATTAKASASDAGTAQTALPIATDGEPQASLGGAKGFAPIDGAGATLPNGSGVRVAQVVAQGSMPLPTTLQGRAPVPDLITPKLFATAERDPATTAPLLEAADAPPATPALFPRARTASEPMPLRPPAAPAAAEDAAVTDPQLPAQKAPRKPSWATGLAARIDEALDSHEFGKETPIAAPSNAELRNLLGQPDPTKQQSIVELERLRRAAEPRRAPHPTAEVDPDDIEAAIEVAPPARRAHVVARKPTRGE